MNIYRDFAKMFKLSDVVEIFRKTVDFIAKFENSMTFPKLVQLFNVFIQLVKLTPYSLHCWYSLNYAAPAAAVCLERRSLTLLLGFSVSFSPAGMKPKLLRVSLLELLVRSGVSGKVGEVGEQGLATVEDVEAGLARGTIDPRFGDDAPSSVFKVCCSARVVKGPQIPSVVLPLGPFGEKPPLLSQACMAITERGPKKPSILPT
jgi:hypothetical protein